MQCLLMKNRFRSKFLQKGTCSTSGVGPGIPVTSPALGPGPLFLQPSPSHSSPQNIDNGKCSATRADCHVPPQELTAWETKNVDRQKASGEAVSTAWYKFRNCELICAAPPHLPCVRDAR